MATSVKQACNALTPSQNGVELAKVLGSMQADIASIAASLNRLITDYNANTTIATDTTAAAVTLKTSA